MVSHTGQAKRIRGRRNWAMPRPALNQITISLSRYQRETVLTTVMNRHRLSTVES